MMLFFNSYQAICMATPKQLCAANNFVLRIQVVIIELDYRPY